MKMDSAEAELAMELHISEAEARELLLAMGMVKKDKPDSSDRFTLDSCVLARPKLEPAL